MGGRAVGGIGAKKVRVMKDMICWGQSRTFEISQSFAQHDVGELMVDNNSPCF
jgi:hypothetical protein